jgi:hypothetical protein
MVVSATLYTEIVLDASKMLTSRPLYLNGSNLHQVVVSTTLYTESFLNASEIHVLIHEPSLSVSLDQTVARGSISNFRTSKQSSYQ